MSPRNKTYLSFLIVLFVSVQSSASVISVKFLTEHRMEFNTEVILVEGIVQETITGEKACPSCLPCLKEGLCAPCPMGCAQPRIFLTDIVEPQFPRLMVLLREGDEVYKEGQRVMVTGRVDAGPAAVVVHKIYE